MACLRSALKVRMVVVDRFDIEQVKGYTIMPNYHQRDRTLSIKAKGILSQMFSLPEGWDYTLRGLRSLSVRYSQKKSAAPGLELEAAPFFVFLV